MDNLGFEIYAGPINTIRTACADEILFEKLRCGEITKDFVHFAPAVNPGDILHLERALAEMMEQPVELDIDREELDNGVFVDRLRQEWVQAVASLSDRQADELQQRWIQSFMDEEDRKPDWASIDQATILRKFMEVCRAAMAAGTDVAKMWLF